MASLFEAVRRWSRRTPTAATLDASVRQPGITGLIQPPI